MPDFNNIRSQPSAEIIARESKLEMIVTHDSPALLGEWYPITVNLKNVEDHSISGVVLDISLQANPEDPSLEQSS